MARFQVALRHTNQLDPINPFRFDDIVVDFNKGEVTRDRKLITLTAGEFKTLQSLIQNANSVTTRSELLKSFGLSEQH